MFDVGFSELVLLFVIGLLILGPERLPRVAAKLGRWVGHARRTATQLRLQFEREMTMHDIMNQQRKPPPAKPPRQETDEEADAATKHSAVSTTDDDSSTGGSKDAPPQEKPAEHADEPH